MARTKSSRRPGPGSRSRQNVSDRAIGRAYEQRRPLPEERAYETKTGGQYVVTKVVEGPSIFSTPRGKRLQEIFSKGKKKGARR